MKPTTTKPTSLEYVGPAGQESPVFGPLVPGERYQHEDAAFVAYLCEKHPEYWRRPTPPPLAPAKE